MTREIKFRAWDSEHKKMFPVGVLGIYDNCTWQHSFNHTHNTQEWYGEYGFVIDPVLMQYTGLKDKNGVEIYEGDIVLSPYNETPKEVKYGLFNDNREYKMVSSIGFYTTIECGLGLDIYGKMTLEVIGNIYENPELLK